MNGILVFTRDEVLQHKLKDGKRKDNSYCFWEITRFPKQFDKVIEKMSINDSKTVLDIDDYIFDDGDGYLKIIDVSKFDFRLYIAVKGKVQGYFKILTIDKDESNDLEKHELRFHSEDWVEIKKGEQLKPSQGWRYYLHG